MTVYFAKRACFENRRAPKLAVHSLVSTNSPVMTSDPVELNGLLLTGPSCG